MKKLSSATTNAVNLNMITARILSVNEHSAIALFARNQFIILWY